MKCRQNIVEPKCCLSYHPCMSLRLCNYYEPPKNYDNNKKTYFVEFRFIILINLLVCYAVLYTDTHKLNYFLYMYNKLLQTLILGLDYEIFSLVSFIHPMLVLIFETKLHF